MSNTRYSVLNEVGEKVAEFGEDVFIYLQNFPGWENCEYKNGKEDD